MKVFFGFTVFILDFIFVSQVFAYDKNITNMSIVVLSTYIIISFIVWGFHILSKNKVIWAFVLHNVIFTASCFSLLLHSFTDNRGTVTIILSLVMFLLQSGMFIIYYTKYLPKEYSNT